MASEALMRSQAELPPRARRILWGVEIYQVKGGTTSACAENTFFASIF